MENNLSGTCMTYAKFSSIKRTCFKEIDRKICCNSRSVNTWLRHPRSLLIREWSKCSLFCCSSFTPNEEQFSLANFLPSPRFLIPRNEKGDWADRRTGENTVYQDVKNGQETGGDTVITMEVGQSSECCFPMTHKIRAPESQNGGEGKTPPNRMDRHSMKPAGNWQLDIGWL